MSKVALMCGHGRSTDGTWDCGTSYGGNNEAALMLPITKAAVKYLRSYGVTVISDADTNNNKNMIADVAWANKEKAIIYVSLHCDYYKAPSGTLPLYVSAKGKELATKINNAVMSGMGMKTRGVTKRTDLYELNYTDMPACIFETGSIKADISKLKDTDKYGKFIAIGICNYLGVNYEADAPTVSDGKLSVDGKGGKKTVKRLQEFLGCADVDGIISGQNKSLIYSYAPALSAVEYGSDGSPTVKNLQRWVGVTQDGVWGKNTTLALQKKLGVTADGIAGLNTFKALQTWLNTHDKADYPAPTPTPSTNASKIIAKAKALAGSTSKPTKAYQNALNKVYPNRKSWGTGSRLGRACDVFVGTVVRSLGYDKDCPRGLNEQLTHKPNNKYFTRYVYQNVRPYDVSKKGDIIFYDKPNGHTCIRTATGIYEANHSSKKYPHFTKGFGRLKPKRNKVVIWRAK